MVTHWLRWYWDWAGSNVGAMPACGLFAVLSAVCFRRPAAAWWHRHFGARQDLADIKAVADAAHRIAADLYKHHTGHHHPDAPDQ